MKYQEALECDHHYQQQKLLVFAADKKYFHNTVQRNPETEARLSIELKNRV